MLDEKNELMTKVENLQDLVKNDQIKIKKMGQEINSFGSVSDENAQLKHLYNFFIFFYLSYFINLYIKNTFFNNFPYL